MSCSPFSKIFELKGFSLKSSMYVSKSLDCSGDWKGYSGDGGDGAVSDPRHRRRPIPGRDVDGGRGARRRRHRLGGRAGVHSDRDERGLSRFRS